ncbi:MAG: hydrolase 1, exosortase A system-associated [Sphingomonas sp.]
MRKIVEFDCVGDRLVGTLDTGGSSTGLLIVSGGNEVRAGAHRGMARLARLIADLGCPVFRFDRRGVGDSTGANGSFRASRPDINGAIAAFRHHAPGVRRIIGFGICDAATALALFGEAIDRLVLANPWLHDDGDGLPNADAIRARYAYKLRDPSNWARALTGGISFGKVAKGVGKIAMGGSPRDRAMETDLFAALKRRGDSVILVANGDGTGLTFLAAADRHDFVRGIKLIETDSHSFARNSDEAVLITALTEVLGITPP